MSLARFATASAASLAILIASSVVSHAAATDERKLDPVEQSIVSDAVGEALKDPDSAKFKWLPISARLRNGPAVYCARVNAKNSYGAYVGYTVFSVIARLKNGQIVEVSDLSLAGEPSSKLNRVMRDQCLSAGFGDLFPGEMTDDDIKRQFDRDLAETNEAIRRARQQIEEMDRRMNTPVE